MPATTILLVDDNETSRFAIRAVLEHHGYAVLEAAAANAALDLLESDPGTIGAAVIDAVLPGMSGIELARLIRERRPEVAVLIISGFPLQQLIRRGLIEDGEAEKLNIGFLQKPFLPQALVRNLPSAAHSAGRKA